MTVREALVHGAALLKTAGISTPALDASLLLADILNTGKAGLILAGPEPLDETVYCRFEQSLERRRAGECTAYILGRKEFRGLDFTVTADVLVPRPDTETLVEATLTRIDELTGRQPPFPPVTALDLCTGSGALAISLKHERPAIQVCASDISANALVIARKNAKRLLGDTLPCKDGEPLWDAHPSKVTHLSGSVPSSKTAESPIYFIESDLFDHIDEAALTAFPYPSRFDLIVSNPPYVPSAIIDTLSREVRREPRIALDGGGDGLELIRRIIAGAPKHLTSGGILLMEADPAQMPAITRILESGGYYGVQTYKDLTGQPRVISGIYSD
jgi:release factor glutamine methyltransferase